MDIDGLWLFSGSICWKRLEDSVIFPYHFILRHIRYGRVCQNMPEISAPRPPMDFTRFFPGWDRYQAKRGAAKLDSEAEVELDRNTGVKGEVSAELSNFRCVFFSGLRPSNMLSKRNWNPFCLRKVEFGSSGST